MIAVERKIVKATAPKIDYGSIMLQKIAELERRSGVKLNLFQKIILAETGTVEQVLSILTGSAIRVKVIDQKENTKTITRQSHIMSERGAILIKANSKIFPKNLPKMVLQHIKQKEFGIGTIIASIGLETFRKIVEVGYNPATRSAFRKYQVVYKEKIAFEITEELVGMEGGPSGV